MWYLNKEVINKFMSNLFAKLEKEAFRAGITPKTRESRAWFRKKAQQMNISSNALMRDQRLSLGSEANVGSMCMFIYDAKGKETLPYWDKFPLSIIVGPAEKGFYGINLHYLPMTLRAKFLDALLDFTNNDRLDDSTKFNLSYNMLKKAAKTKYFKPCFKHYLTNQIKGNIATVAASEWEIAAFLPTANFQGASNDKVWSDSRRIISA